MIDHIRRGLPGKSSKPPKSEGPRRCLGPRHISRSRPFDAHLLRARPQVLYLREHQPFTPFAPDTLWTTKYIDATVEQLRAEGHEIRDEDIARLSPLKHRNLNLLGRYSFTASTPAAGALRPLRDPDAPGVDDDDEGQEE
ncbi:transposase [Streptomyces sp. NBC_00829]|nr:transposase [Streptomyces sp. NBC_00829]